MFRSSLQNSCLYKCLIFHFNCQQEIKQKRFFKLETQIEVIDLSSQIIDVQLIIDWAGNGKYFKVIKVKDNSQAQFQFAEFIKQNDCFVISIQNNFKQFMYRDILTQELKIIKQSDIGDSITIYIFNFSDLNESSNTNQYYPNICRLVNSMYLNNSISMKWLSYKDINHLIAHPFYHQYNDIIDKVLDLSQLIQWQDNEQYEQLLDLLQTQDNYKIEDKHFKSYFDLFDLSDDDSQYMQIYLQSQCIIFEEIFKFTCFRGDQIKDNMIFCKQKNQILQIDLLNAFLGYYKARSKMLIIIEVPDDLQDIEQEFINLYSNNPKLFSGQLFLQEKDQNHILINQITESYLQIQDDLSEVYQSLTNEERQIVKSQFIKLLIDRYILNQL